MVHDTLGAILTGYERNADGSCCSLEKLDIGYLILTAVRPVVVREAKLWLGQALREVRRYIALRKVLQRPTKKKYAGNFTSIRYSSGNLRSKGSEPEIRMLLSGSNVASE